MITLTTFTPSPGSYVLVYTGNGSVINTTQGLASLVYRYLGHCQGPQRGATCTSS